MSDFQTRYSTTGLPSFLSGLGKNDATCAQGTQRAQKAETWEQEQADSTHSNESLSVVGSSQW